MKKLRVFDKYETPYSWKESVRSGAPRKKEKPYPRRIVTALQLGLTVIAICAIGAFVMIFDFNGISNSTDSSHSGDFSTVITNPNTKPDTPNGSNTGLTDNAVSGRVTKFRSNGYMVITAGAVSYNVKVPAVVIDHNNNIIKLTDDVKAFAVDNSVESRVIYDGMVRAYTAGALYTQIDNTYSLVLDLSQMPADYEAAEQPDPEELFMENAYNAYCSSFAGYENAYSYQGYLDFTMHCKREDDKLMYKNKSNSDLEFTAVTPVGMFANNDSVINPVDEIAYEYRYVLALRSKDGSDVYEEYETMRSKNTVVPNSTELSEAGLSRKTLQEECFYYFESTPDTIYVVLSLSFGITAEIVAQGPRQIIESGVPIEFAVGVFSDSDVQAISDGSASFICLCDDPSTCKHSKMVGTDESGLLLAVIVGSKENTSHTE